MRALILAAPALALVTGCMVDRQYTDPFAAVGQDNFDNGELGNGSELQIQNGWVRGDIGQVRNFDAAANDASGYSDGSYSSVTVTAYDAQERMGMLIVDLSGVDIRNARAGTYRFGALSTDTVDGGSLNVTGCSESTDSYYDSPANDGTVVISDTQQGRQVDVEATLPNDQGTGDTQATGSFVIARQ